MPMSTHIRVYIQYIIYVRIFIYSYLYIDLLHVVPYTTIPLEVFTCALKTGKN